jgi:hypothetical protein
MIKHVPYLDRHPVIRKVGNDLRSSLNSFGPAVITDSHLEPDRQGRAVLSDDARRGGVDIGDFIGAKKVIEFAELFHS